MKTILKGLWIGATMTVPGVSGGTMAVIIGIYEDLIRSFNGLIKHPKDNISFLLKFIIGAGAGFFLLAGIISKLLEKPVVGELLCFFFCGIVAGGIPLLVSKAKVQKVNWKHIGFVLIGAAIVVLIMLLPKGFIQGGTGVGAILLQLLGGFIVAVALILPGISASHMLYVLGLYTFVLQKVYAFQVLSLIPLAVGLLIGCFLTAGVLEKLMEKYTTGVYLVIIGFVAGSLISLFPKNGLKYLIPGVCIFILGFIIMYYVSSNLSPLPNKSKVLK